MKFVNLINNFARDEDGAVTVDWVVQTRSGQGFVNYDL